MPSRGSGVGGFENLIQCVKLWCFLGIDDCCPFSEATSNHNSISTKAVANSKHVPVISEDANSHFNHQTESESDVRKEIQECRTLISSLEREIDFERRKKNEAESFCSELEKELQSERKARQIADIKYEKLLKRYDVISVKLKAAEERCKKLVEELNNESGMDANYDSLEDDADEDEDNYDDNDISYEETPPLSPEIQPVNATQLKAVANKTPEFELEMNVMEALVGAVMDIGLLTLFAKQFVMKSSSCNTIL